MERVGRKTLKSVGRNTIGEGNEENIENVRRNTTGEGRQENIEECREEPHWRGQ